ncbi:MAG: hypothetical protein ACLPVO_20720 [Desulfomonilaceae bacterium]
METIVSSGPEMVSDFGTPQGRIAICARCPVGSFNHLELDSGIGNFKDYSSIWRRENLENL